MMQQGQAEQFRGSRDDKVHGPGAAVPALGGEVALYLPGAGIRAVMHRYPAKRGPQVPDQVFPILRRSGTIEELKLRDQSLACNPRLEGDTR